MSQMGQQWSTDLGNSFLPQMLASLAASQQEAGSYSGAGSSSGLTRKEVEELLKERLFAQWRKCTGTLGMIYGLGFVRPQL